MPDDPNKPVQSWPSSEVYDYATMPIKRVSLSSAGGGATWFFECGICGAAVMIDMASETNFEATLAKHRAWHERIDNPARAVRDRGPLDEAHWDYICANARGNPTDRPPDWLGKVCAMGVPGDWAISWVDEALKRRTERDRAAGAASRAAAHDPFGPEYEREVVEVPSTEPVRSADYMAGHIAGEQMWTGVIDAIKAVIDQPFSSPSPMTSAEAMRAERFGKIAHMLQHWNET